MPDGDISILISGIDPGSNLADVIPTLDEIGTINRAATASINGGRPLGTFNDLTRPTGQEVELLAVLAAGAVADTLGHDIAQEFVDRARGAAVFYAAALVEGASEEPRDRMIDRWTKFGDDRVAAITKQMADVGAGGEEGPSDDELVPIYNFPAACPLPDQF